MLKLLKRLRKRLRNFLNTISHAAGSVSAFIVALLIVGLWASSGHWFDYSEQWQLIINTITTIVTFLLVFSIQYSSNRDTKEIKMMITALMRQNKELSEQLKAIEEELDDD
jgi:low affinity Fe/Cu permease